MNILRKNIIQYILKRLYPRVQMFGARFEWDMPPEFVITKHAHQRIQERMRVTDHKMLPIAVKAWLTPGGEKLIEQYISPNHRQKNRKFRVFQGRIFVYKVQYNALLARSQKVLITVIAPGDFKPSSIRKEMDSLTM